MLFLKSAQSEFVSIFTGKPIINTIEAPGDIVIESGVGISCSTEDPPPLSHAIQSLNSLTPAERSAMGKRGRE